MQSREVSFRASREAIAAVLGTLALALAILLAMSQRAADPDIHSTDARSRAKTVEGECRRSCSRWIVSQCDAQNAAHGESVFQCASRLASIFQDCVDRCRGR